MLAIPERRGAFVTVSCFRWLISPFGVRREMVAIAARSYVAFDGRLPEAIPNHVWRPGAAPTDSANRSACWSAVGRGSGRPLFLFMTGVPPP